MSWEACTRTFIRKVSPDPEKIASLIETALARRKFVQSIVVTEKNVSFIIENYYEVLKELLVALLLQHGMRSSNHQCLFTFFSREYGHDAEVAVIKQLNYLRNRLEYYGEQMEYNYFKENHKSFEHIIDLLLKLVRA